MSHASVMVAVDVDEEDLVAAQMAPFDERGEWFWDGSRWDWWEVGGRFSCLLGGRDTLKVADISRDQLEEHRCRSLTETYELALKEHAHRELLFGVKNGETLESFLKRNTMHWFPACHAFLRRRRWNEPRMDWFGTQTATECEITGKKPRRCLTRATAPGGEGAVVVTWNEGWEEWQVKFYQRFIRPLPSNTTLVVVDYHA